MERVENADEMQSEINRLTSATLKMTVQIGNGSVLLSISILALLVPLTDIKMLPDLTGRLDAFIGEQGRH